MRRYLDGSLEDLHDPRQMKGVLEAVKRLRQAEAGGRKLALLLILIVTAFFRLIFCGAVFSRLELRQIFIRPTA